MHSLHLYKTIFCLLWVLAFSLGANTDQAAAYLKKSKASFSENDFVNTVKNIQQYKKIKPNDHFGWQLCGRALYELQKYDRALAEFDRAIQLYDKDFVSKTYKAHILIKKGRAGQSFTLLENARQLSPDYPDAHIVLAEAYLVQNDPKKARACMRKATESLLIADAKVYRKIADVYLRYKMPNDAIYTYNQYIQEDPECGEINYQMGKIFESTKSKRAEYYYKKAVANEPENIIYGEKLANYFYGQKQIKEAKTAYEKVLPLGKLQPQSYYHIGMIYFNANQVDKALPLLKKAVAAKPEIQMAQLALCAGYLRKENYPESIRHANLLLQYDPNNETAYYNSACAYAQLGQTDKALQALKKAIALEPANKELAKKEVLLRSLQTNPRFKEITK